MARRVAWERVPSLQSVSLSGNVAIWQYQGMSDRERSFRVVMGQEEVARLIAPDSESTIEHHSFAGRDFERTQFQVGADRCRVRAVVRIRPFWIRLVSADAWSPS